MLRMPVPNGLGALCRPLGIAARRRAARAAAGAAVAALALGACAAAPSPSPGSPSPPAVVSQVRVFFVAGGMDPCGDLAPVVREVEDPAGPATALRELLRGPTPEETAAGFTSLFGPATADALQGVVVSSGIARVSFRDLRSLIPGASTACGSAALLAALDATLAQFPGILGARYSFGGDEAAFYEWLQLAPPD